MPPGLCPQMLHIRPPQPGLDHCFQKRWPGRACRCTWFSAGLFFFNLKTTLRCLWTRLWLLTNQFPGEDAGVCWWRWGPASRVQWSQDETDFPGEPLPLPPASPPHLGLRAAVSSSPRLASCQPLTFSSQRPAPLRTGSSAPSLPLQPLDLGRCSRAERTRGFCSVGGRALVFLLH